MRRKKFSLEASRILAVLVMALIPPAAAHAANTYKVLHSFNGSPDGANPYAAVIFDARGNLYGTTTAGGSNGMGTVFKMTPKADGSWAEKVIYNFSSLGNCADGSGPQSQLTFDAAGNLYGTANGGVTSSCDGCGVVFKLAPNSNGTWTESVLYSFCSVAGCADGSTPSGGLIFDKAGTLYGTTEYGPSSNECSPGCGVVFKLAPNSNGTWMESVLYSFCSVAGCADGLSPLGSLIFDTAGNLYGTTQSGGLFSADCPNDGSGCGVVFKLRPNSNGSWTESVLYSFCSVAACADGFFPDAGLIFDAAGSLYGTTFWGGACCPTGGSGGVVFKLTANSDGSWRENVIHVFHGHPAAEPHAGVSFDAAGNLYGTTVDSESLPGKWGAIFKLGSGPGGGWTYDVLHTFRDTPAARPYAGLVVDKVGNLYGTATDCGSGYKCEGVVFEMIP
jgi:uncharacterized repeat protein (TIGR03803 family)